MESKGKIGIVGSGLIGQNWALIFIAAGYEVSLFNPGARPNVTVSRSPRFLPGAPVRSKQRTGRQRSRASHLDHRTVRLEADSPRTVQQGRSIEARAPGLHAKRLRGGHDSCPGVRLRGKLVKPMRSPLS